MSAISPLQRIRTVLTLVAKWKGQGEQQFFWGAGGGHPAMGPRLGQGLDWRIKNFRWRAGA
ncbi:hypothetical protein RE6C_03671 [Rhodopirellula europaea 6C]|uniref:Uncharacterized protein n=1 Tax=Rhodopirellula europaea 6C TaxID=1263867 RepID=M2ASB1_9BACT|nr:hypothetical protein RE6C_03671 [Rhodopirellula europaea 6C]